MKRHTSIYVGTIKLITHTTHTHIITLSNTINCGNENGAVLNGLMKCNSKMFGEQFPVFKIHGMWDSHRNADEEIVWGGVFSSLSLSFLMDARNK